MTRLYALIVSMYPPSVRSEYGPAMTSMFNDMLRDPSIPRRRAWLALLADFSTASRRATQWGALFGLVIFLIWLANRAIDLGPFDPGTFVPLGVVALLFVAAGFIGARLSGSLLTGIWAGMVAGLISSLTMVGDWVWIGFRPDGIVFVFVVAGLVVMALVSAGAELACFGRHRIQFARGARAFLSEWARTE